MAGMGCLEQTAPSPVQSLTSGLARVAVVIPAWQPDGQLHRLAGELRRLGFARIMVVDDGSTGDAGGIFASLRGIDGLELCRHGRNQGKGRALKTAFARALAVRPQLAGVVTADADGQHTPDDILRVAEALLEETAPGGAGRSILGMRSFAGNVPWRSRFGNTVACALFTLLSGCRVHDTQTGLRGLPSTLLPELEAVPGERYEYEIAMLMRLCRRHGTPRQVAIGTVYLDGNRGSHFRPLRDSLRVLGMLVRIALLRGERSPSRHIPTEEPAFHTA